jgi:ribosomal protein L37AE/L43A
MSGKIRYCCHFCGRSDSLNKIEEENTWVCSKCWELIAIIASKWYAAGAKVLVGEDDDADI